MNESTRTPGKTTIAPDVLISIAKLTALGVPGVARLSEAPSDVKKLFKTHRNDGVKIEIENNSVYADLYLVLKGDAIVRDVCNNVQNQVARAISEMVGMEVGRINIHVEDITYGSEES